MMDNKKGIFFFEDILASCFEIGLSFTSSGIPISKFSTVLYVVTAVTNTRKMVYKIYLFMPHDLILIHYCTIIPRNMLLAGKEEQLYLYYKR